MKTEHWTGEMPCNINGFRKTESLIVIIKVITFCLLFTESQKKACKQIQLQLTRSLYFISCY